MQVTARSDRDLTPEGIVQKVADASGAKYGGGPSTSASSGASAAPPPPASKPVFMPTRVGGGGGFNPLGGSRARTAAIQDSGADQDGWGADAPPVTRRQLEKVESAYKPTKVNMAELTSQKQETSKFQAPQRDTDNGDVVRGGYQPIGKVDIGAIRRQAQEQGKLQDDRPTTVKGAYEPVGKVDIAAIRAKAQAPSPSPGISQTPTGTSQRSNEPEEAPKSLAERSAAFTQSGRLDSMPKPKVTNRFGSTTSSFAGTKAPTPSGFTAKPLASAAPVGVASKTFADEGGKTPAQIWAEKKARERGTSGAADNPPSFGGNAPTSPIRSQPSGGWQSGYTGKKWGDVQTNRTGASNVSAQRTGQDEREQEQGEEPTPSAGGVGALRDRFKNAAPMGAAAGAGIAAGAALGHYTAEDEDDDDQPSAPVPPPMDLSSKPNAGARGVPIPGLSQPPAPQAHDVEDDVPEEEHVDLPPPPAQPRSPSPSPPASPPRIAMPVSRTAAPEPIEPAEEELSAPPSVPAASLSKAIDNARPHLEEEPQVEDDDPARGAAESAADTTFGAGAGRSSGPGASVGGRRALIQYDYEKAEDNEIELREGEYVTDIEMVDEDWWMGQNSKGETGLFPSNYVELVEGDDEGAAPGPAPTQPQEELAPPAGPPAPAGGAADGQTATAQYDYEAAEDNELSFPDGAKITGVVSASPPLPFYRFIFVHALSGVLTVIANTGVPGRGLVVRPLQGQGRSLPVQLCHA